jgi:membrane-associated phospholipid phosphatase
VNSLIVFGASDLLFVMAAAFLIVLVVAEDGPGRLRLVASAVLGLVLVFALISIAAAIHADPRPFVQNPSLRPLISHAADNGFPSDHSAAAGLIATLVALRHRLYGALLAVTAVLVAAARVAAHVHHVQDVVAGLLLGGLAAWVAALIVGLVLTRLTPRLKSKSAKNARTAHRA